LKEIKKFGKINILHSDKVLITGATGGLGHHLTEYFLKKNHPVIISSKSTSKLINQKNNFSKNDSNIQYFKCNLLNYKEILDLSKFCKKNKVKILVNNAAIVCPSKLLSDYTFKEIHSMISVNLEAPILLSYLLQKDLTDIININSINGLEHKKNRTIYSASKWGLRGFSESFKKESKNLNILDVYSSNIRTWTTRNNSMDPITVVSKIYNSFKYKESNLIIDGRPKK
tara:strand:- start:5353 stop:6036 length:684 start_codon:yes stop_codon:yes gene_type:complete